MSYQKIVIILKALETDLRTWGYWNLGSWRRDTVRLGLSVLRRKLPAGAGGEDVVSLYLGGLEGAGKWGQLLLLRGKAFSC